MYIMKTCKSCSQEKPLDEFHKDKQAKDGLTFYCKPCNKARALEWYHSNRERGLERRKQWHHSNTEYVRDQKLLKTYGINLAQYHEILASQGGVCAVCGGPERMADGRAMPVDHCHRTGKVRGILCSHCNRAIGLLGDDPETLIRASAYLARKEGLGFVPQADLTS